VLFNLFFTSMAKKLNIKKAIKKPWQLHKDLWVPTGQPIPASKLESASKLPWKVWQRARFAKTLKKINKNK